MFEHVGWGIVKQGFQRWQVNAAAQDVLESLLTLEGGGGGGECVRTEDITSAMYMFENVFI